MGEKITLKLDKRLVQGKKVARLRKDNLVPGVIYGQGFEPILLQAPYQAVEKVFKEAGWHTPVVAQIGKQNKIAMIKNVERDPAKGSILHLSLHAVKADEIVSAEVPIKMIGEGESPAERAGLVILQAIESIEVKAKPADLPEALEVSLLNLENSDDKLTLADITLPKGVEFADTEQDLELAVASVYEPSALQAANDAAGGDETEAEAEDVPVEHGEDDAS